MIRDKHYSKELTKNELETLKRLRHPYITSYYGCCFTDDEDWIVMEFCEIGSIENVMETLGETIAERYIAIIIKSILQALDYLHNDVQVLHRDLKSANILLTPDADVKIADFGVSRELQRQLTFNAYGTPHWMAPEIWSEQGYNYPADIWSLGITAYEMAEGDPPHSDLGPLVLYLKLKKEGPPRLPDDTSYYSADFRDFIRCCLTIDPQKRSTARQLLNHPFIKKAEHKSALEEIITRYKDKVREKKRAEKEKAKKKKEKEGPSAAPTTKDKHNPKKSDVDDDIDLDLDLDLDEFEMAPKKNTLRPTKMKLTQQRSSATVLEKPVDSTKLEKPYTKK